MEFWCIKICLRHCKWMTSISASALWLRYNFQIWMKCLFARGVWTVEHEVACGAGNPGTLRSGMELEVIDVWYRHGCWTWWSKNWLTKAQRSWSCILYPWGRDRYGLIVGATSSIWNILARLMYYQWHCSSVVLVQIFLIILSFSVISILILLVCSFN